MNHRTRVSRYQILGSAAGVMLLLLSIITIDSAAASGIEWEVPESIETYYDPFSGLPVVEGLRIELRRQSGEVENEKPSDAQAYNLKLRPAHAGFRLRSDKTGSEIPLIISTVDSHPFEQRGDDYLHFINYNADTTGSKVVLYNLKVPNSVWAEPGHYQSMVDIELVSAHDPSNVVLRRSVFIGVTVEPKLQANLAGQVGSFTDGVDVAVIDFGNLETGESRRVFIQVRGNTKAQISLTSEHKGRMVHESNPKWTVDYSIDVDGETSSLATPLRLERSVARDFRGSAYPMEITVGDVSRSFAGKYQDVITVDVSPM